MKKISIFFVTLTSCALYSAELTRGAPTMVKRRGPSAQDLLEQQKTPEQALYDAIAVNDTSAATRALRRGADVNMSIRGETPLMRTAKYYHHRWRASVGTLGSAAMSQEDAAKIGGYAIFNTLLDMGADPYAKDMDGQSVFDYAHEFKVVPLLNSIGRLSVSVKKTLPPLPAD